MVEVYYNCQSDNGSLTDNHALQQWSAKYMSSLGTIKDLRVPLRLGTMMTAAGLVELETRMIPLPLCGWPKGASDVPPVLLTVERPQANAGMLTRRHRGPGARHRRAQPRERQPAAALAGTLPLHGAAGHVDAGVPGVGGARPTRGGRQSAEAVLSAVCLLLRR